MIIFYYKKTGIIFGKVDGRVHDDNTLEKVFIKPENVSKKDIGKYVVPFVPNMVEVEETVTEMRVVDKKTLRVENVIIGKRKIKKIKGMKINKPFADIIYKIEDGKENLFDYKVKLNKKGKVVNLTKH